MSQAYCNNCKEVIPLNGHIKKAVCKCGGTGLIVAYSRWSDKIGWDYFDSNGKFLKFVAHIPYGLTVEHPEITEVKQPIKQLGLFEIANNS